MYIMEGNLDPWCRHADSPLGKECEIPNIYSFPDQCPLETLEHNEALPVYGITGGEVSIGEESIGHFDVASEKSVNKNEVKLEFESVKDD